jgi:hypothetical protein
MNVLRGIGIAMVTLAESIMKHRRSLPLRLQQGNTRNRSNAKAGNAIVMDHAGLPPALRPSFKKVARRRAFVYVRRD